MRGPLQGHSYNSPVLAPHPTVRLVVILTPLALGFTFSVTACCPACAASCSAAKKAKLNP